MTVHMEIQTSALPQAFSAAARVRGERPAREARPDAPAGGNGLPGLRRLHHFAESVLSPREMNQLEKMFKRFGQVEDPTRQQFKSFYDHALGFIEKHAGDPGQGGDFNPRPVLNRILNFAEKNLAPREQEQLKGMLERFMKVEDKTPEQWKHFLREAVAFVKDHAGDGRPRLDVVG